MAGSRKQLGVLGMAFLGCLLLTLAVGIAFRRWKDRPPHRPTVSGGVLDIRRDVVIHTDPGDLPASLELPARITQVEREWEHLREAYHRESEDEIRFSLSKFQEFGLDAVSVLLPILKDGPDPADSLLAMAALAHSRRGGEPADLGELVLAQALDEGLDEDGRALARSVVLQAGGNRLQKKLTLIALGSSTLPWGIEVLRQYLLSAAANEETELLAVAIRSVGQVPGDEGTKLLTELLARPLPVEAKEQIVGILADSPSPSLASEIQRQLAGPASVEDKVLLIRLLTRISSAPDSPVRITDALREEVRPVLATVLKDVNTSESLKEQAIHALGGFGDEKSQEIIADALRTQVSPEILRIASEELAQHGQPPVAVTLIAGFTGERFTMNEILRISAAIDIADRERRPDIRVMAVDKGVVYLKKLLIETRHGSLKQDALKVLVKMGPETANPILRDVARDSNEHNLIRRRALNYLQVSGRREDLVMLQQIVVRDDEPPEIRDLARQTVEAISRRGE